MSIPTVFVVKNDNCFEFFCYFCRSLHQHGAIEGHRLSHCTNQKSPYRDRGYMLRLPPQNQSGETVYYLRLGNRIKIGWTRNLSAKMKAIPHEQLLALEPGGLSVEAQRHQQFEEFKIVGEWFRSCPVIMRHVASLEWEPAK